MGVGRGKLFWMVWALGAAAWVCNKPTPAQIAEQGIPTITYAAAFSPFFEGEYKDALELFEDEWRGAIKTPQSRWIDSICYHTMIGECYYRLGQLDKALAHYNAALNLYLAFPNWLASVQFPVSVAPAQRNYYTGLPWGPMYRKAVPGRIPGQMLIRIGAFVTPERLRQGGVVTPPTLVPIDVGEIVRMTVLAMRRRIELLGPLCVHDQMTKDLLAALSRNPGLPNHWSQAWVDAEYGLALLASGRVSDALPVLNRSLVLAGQYDHILTPTVLLVLGKLALQQGDLERAGALFHDATVAAVQFEDGIVLEEAFRYLALTAIAANKPAAVEELRAATQWAKVKGLRQLRASCLVSAAEILLTTGEVTPAQIKTAVALLDEADTTIGRRTMRLGYTGARLQYVRAIGLMQQGDIAGGERCLADCMAFMRHGSKWLFQIAQMDLLAASGNISVDGPWTPRMAVDTYRQLLADPTGVDWVYRPMESLAVLTTPHSQSYEFWFLIALSRQDFELAVEVADRARRHRLFSSLPYGGRLLALRWVLEASDDQLTAEARLNRQDLLAEYPLYSRLRNQASQLQAQLGAIPFVSDDEEQRKKQRALFSQWQAICLQQESLLRQMAIRRHPAEMLFPPVMTLKEIRSRLPEGAVLLVFFQARGDLYGMMFNRQDYDVWRLPAQQQIRRSIAAFLKTLGQWDALRQLGAKELQDTSWQKAGAELLRLITRGSRADFTADFPELIIVPDGPMWYVPFEALVVEIKGQPRTLVSRFRIRYAPTAALAVWNPASRQAIGRTLLVLGRLHPQGDDSLAEQAFRQLSQSVPSMLVLAQGNCPAPSATVVGLFDRLVVVDNLRCDIPVWEYSFVQQGGIKPGNTLADWMALPWQGPKVVVLAGFHTAAETALRNAPDVMGAELFLTCCGLMASGARTVLISRWNIGGQAAIDLVSEFLRELPNTTPADAWQRAVLLVSDTLLDQDAEPRVNFGQQGVLLKADHPFFWASFMLVDSLHVPKQEVPDAAGQQPPVVEIVPEQAQ